MMKKALKKVLERFGMEIRKRSDSHLTPITSQWMGNFYYFIKIYDLIRKVPGDIVECGVGRGRTFLYLAFLVADENQERILWGFDSFMGFPAPSVEDMSPRNPQKGERNWVKINDINWLLKDAGIKEEFLKSHIRLVPGFFEKSLGKFSGKSIALLHLDVDLYQSYADCLEILYPKVAPGGIVLFDEYDDYNFPGARKAIDEYFRNKKAEIKKDSLSGKHYLIKPLRESF